MAQRPETKDQPNGQTSASATDIAPLNTSKHSNDEDEHMVYPFLADEYIRLQERSPHWRPLSPIVMKQVFELIQRRLHEKRKQLPLCHQLYEWVEGERFSGPTGLCAICKSDGPEIRRLAPIDPPAMGENPADSEDEVPLFLQGWHKDPDHRHELQIWDVSPEDTPFPVLRPRGWHPAKSRFTFGDAEVEVQTQYAKEFFKSDIQKALRLCEKAIEMGVPVYWLSGPSSDHRNRLRKAHARSS